MAEQLARRPQILQWRRDRRFVGRGQASVRRVADPTLGATGQSVLTTDESNERSENEVQKVGKRSKESPLQSAHHDWTKAGWSLKNAE